MVDFELAFNVHQVNSFICSFFSLHGTLVVHTSSITTTIAHTKNCIRVTEEEKKHNTQRIIYNYYQFLRALKPSSIAQGRRQWKNIHGSMRCAHIHTHTPTYQSTIYSFVLFLSRIYEENFFSFSIYLWHSQLNV